MRTNSVKHLAACKDWKELCGTFTEDELVRVLRSFSREWMRILQNFHGFSIQGFINENIPKWLYSTQSKHTIKDIGLLDAVDLLNERIFAVSPNLNRINTSLVMSLYSKMYVDTICARRKFDLPKYLTEEKFRFCTLKLLPRAKELISYMNEQDLSLILNCLAKVNINDDDVIRKTNLILSVHLKDYYRNGDAKDNLIRKMTPQGLSLILNAFSKSDVNLDREVMDFLINHYVPSRSDDFLIFHLAIILHSFLRMNVAFNNIRKIITTTDMRLSKEYSYDIKLISTLLYTFSKYNYFPSLSFPAVLVFLKGENYTKNTELEISNLYYALGRLNIRDMQLLDTMNAGIQKIMEKLTPQAIVNIYNSLSRLDYFKPEYGTKHLDTRSKHPMHNLVFSRFLEYFNGNIAQICIQRHILPRHIINMIFCTTINFILDLKLYNFLLSQLRVNLGIEEGLYRQKYSGCVGIEPSVLFIKKYIGIRGLYQLYAICHYISVYSEDGFYALNLDNLSMIYDLLYHNNDSLKIESGYDEHLVDVNQIDYNGMDGPTISTSKIHDSVFSTLENIISSDSCVPGDSSTEKEGLAKPLLYKEYEITPYVIDISYTPL